MKRRKVFVFILSMAILFQSGFGVLASELSGAGDTVEKTAESRTEGNPGDGKELEDKELKGESSGETKDGQEQDGNSGDEAGGKDTSKEDSEEGEGKEDAPVEDSEEENGEDVPGEDSGEEDGGEDVSGEGLDEEETEGEDSSGDGESDGEEPAEEDLEMQAYIEEAKQALAEIAGKDTLMGIVYLCDSYGVRGTPDENGETIVNAVSGTTVVIEGMELDGEYNIWFKASMESGGSSYTGYIEKTYLAYSNEMLLAWEETFFPQAMFAAESINEKEIAMFPASYQDKLRALKRAHPNWIFVPQNTGLSWDKVVSEECYKDRSLISTTMGQEYRKEYHSPNWDYASEAAIKYYLDPRNFFDEVRIFQFEQLTYNPSYHSQSAVQNILDDTFMSGALPGAGKKYSEAFYEIGVSLKVSPFHLACRVYQEQGQGKSALISGKYKGYEGYYNYFNIGASGSTVEKVIESGLKKAKEKGWNTPYAALKGGAQIISKDYILRGQDTLYLQKFDVDNSDNSLFVHQYMQNIRAPYSESKKVKDAYTKSGALENTFVFKIPVYKGMPSGACPVPTPQPTAKPTAGPTAKPTAQPTAKPTAKPTAVPTVKPTAVPAAKPTAVPAAKPTAAPTDKPAAKPTAASTAKPTAKPTARPVEGPVTEPTPKPAGPTGEPDGEATPEPSGKPSEGGGEPDVKPTDRPTAVPTKKPEEETPAAPTGKPTAAPTAKPTVAPTAKPTAAPTAKPTAAPTAKPTAKPTAVPTAKPTAAPTGKPTSAPTMKPTAAPTARPTAAPTAKPTVAPVSRPEGNPDAGKPEHNQQSVPVENGQNGNEAGNPAATASAAPGNLVSPEPDKVQENTSSAGVSVSAPTPKPQTAPEDKNTLSIDMSKTNMLYSQTLKQIKEQGMEVALNMGSEVSWTIYGNTIESDTPQDVDMKVTMGSSKIPKSRLEIFAGGERYVEMSLAHEGKFGFTAVLSVKLENAQPSEYANLFYYNEEADEFEFMCASQISSTGRAAFEFRHASDYVIILSAETMEGRVDEKEEALEEAKTQEAAAMAQAKEELPAREPGKAAGIIALIVLGSAALGIGAFLIFKKNDDSE